MEGEEYPWVLVPGLPPRRASPDGSIPFTEGLRSCKSAFSHSPLSSDPGHCFLSWLSQVSGAVPPLSHPANVFARP